MTFDVSNKENSSFHVAQCRRDIMTELTNCQLRCLTQACKNLSDLLMAIDESSTETEDAVDIIPAPLPLTGHLFSVYSFAKSLFELKEYERCAYHLREHTQQPLLFFLHIYARYLGAEKKWVENCSASLYTTKKEVRSELIWLKRELESRKRKNELDSYCLYVYAIVLMKLKLREAAVKALSDVLQLNPFLYAAWGDLSQLMETKDELHTLSLPNNWMHDLFDWKVYCEIGEHERAYQCMTKFESTPLIRSQLVRSFIAVTHHNARDPSTAAQHFKEVFEIDPYRLDNIDTYSNILFVQEQSAELANLTHQCIKVDKYRPETCCVIGNYYSLRSQHDKAVQYFQRALRLRPNYAFVWTLVGHEFVELRNLNAAIHAYRQAIELDKRDYRAWYGLGQMYEYLKMYSFALYYYREAQKFHPNDSRCMVALGETYEKIAHVAEAKKCYWRAFCIGDMEGCAILKLAKVYEACEEFDEAAAAYHEYIKASRTRGVSGKLDCVLLRGFRQFVHFTFSLLQYV